MLTNFLVLWLATGLPPGECCPWRHHRDSNVYDLVLSIFLFPCSVYFTLFIWPNISNWAAIFLVVSSFNDMINAMWFHALLLSHSTIMKMFTLALIICMFALRLWINYQLWRTALIMLTHLMFNGLILLYIWWATFGIETVLCSIYLYVLQLEF